jgi:hypothetical protein
MVQRIKTGMIADGAVTAVKVDSNLEDSFSFRNRIHNGDFRINQRNITSRSNTVNNITDANAGGRGMAADRWWNYVLSQATNGMNSSNCTIGIVTDHPSINTGSSYSITVNTNATANANVVTANRTTDFFLFTQQGEGYFFSDLFNTNSTTPMVLSFWVKSNKTGSYSVQIRPNTTSTRTIILPYTISSSGTWEKKVLKVPAFNFGNMTSDNSARFILFFSLASNLKATHTDGETTVTQAQIDACTNQWGPNYWGSGLVVNDHVNIFENTGNYWRVTDVQFETGNDETTFERRPYDQELRICQRYLEYGAPYNAGGITSGIGIINYNFKVQKRANPGSTLTRFNNRGIDGFFFSGNPASPTYYNFTSIGPGDVNADGGTWAWTTGGSSTVSGVAFNQGQDSNTLFSAEI